MSNDPIADYYRRCRERQEAARKKYEEALRRGVEGAELKRLYEAYIDAGNTGD